MVYEPEQAEISIEAKKLQADIQKHRDEIELLIVKLHQIQRKCKHPNIYRYSPQGDTGIRCPDCGYDQ